MLPPMQPVGGWAPHRVATVDSDALLPTRSLKGKTLFITGAARGIGHAIACRAAKDGANVVIAAKTDAEIAGLPGTIHTAAKDVNALGGQALPVRVDVLDEASVQAAITAAVDRFGGIDVLVNNAATIGLTGTAETDMKQFDLLQGVNSRGTFLCTKLCLPHLKKSSNPHVLNISPPLNLDPRWFGPHVAYTIAKYSMSMYALGHAEEFKPFAIGVNALWPRTTIGTAAIDAIPGGAELKAASRTPEIMADAAHCVLTRRSSKCTGNFFIDDELLASEGLAGSSLQRYNVSKDPQFLCPDLFL